jgi:hypothetical protein
MPEIVVAALLKRLKPSITFVLDSTRHFERHGPRLGCFGHLDARPYTHLDHTLHFQRDDRLPHLRAAHAD